MRDTTFVVGERAGAGLLDGHTQSERWRVEQVGTDNPRT
jgi:hypothetical protein